MSRIIAFDIDRTLVDSFKPELESLKEAIDNSLNIKLTNNEIASAAYLTTEDFFKNLKLTKKQIDLIYQEWENTFSKYKISCFPNIISVIKELYKDNYNINIITSRTTNEYHELDEALKEIKDYFNIIVTSDLVSNPKPNKESMDYLCNKLKCNSKDVIYIGDSKADEKFAKNCGCHFIPAIWENKELKDSSNAVKTPKELLKEITKINIENKNTKEE